MALPGHVGHTADSRMLSQQDSENPRSSQQVLVLCVVLCSVFAVLAIRSATTGLSGDELLFLRAIELGPVDGLMSVGSSHPPLGRLIVGSLFSSADPDWMLRSPSVLAALLSVVTWFFILKRVFDDQRLIVVLLPLMALSKSWLDIGPSAGALHDADSLRVDPLSGLAEAIGETERGPDTRVCCFWRRSCMDALLWH